MKINKEGYKIILLSGLFCLLVWCLFYRPVSYTHLTLPTNSA